MTCLVKHCDRRWESWGVEKQKWDTVYDMAFESDSLLRRSVGPALASAAVGIALGIVAVIGVSIVNDHAQAEQSVPAENAVLGDPEYGSRQ